jgi:hypothetical protein
VTIWGKQRKLPDKFDLSIIELRDEMQKLEENDQSKVDISKVRSKRIELGFEIITVAGSGGNAITLLA